MTLRRENLGSAARQFYDAHKQKPSGPSHIAKRVRAGIRSTKHATVEFLNICEKAGVPRPELEFRFHPKCMWRFDCAWPKFKLALEVDGGAWIAGRHNSGAGFTADLEKVNAAAILGWRIMRFTPSQFLTYECVDAVKRALRGGRR